MKVTIADTLFLSHTKSAFIGGGNIGMGPSMFEWEPADPRTARFVTDSCIKDAAGPGQVAWLLEPFFMHPENYMLAMQKDFDAVLTHNRYFSTHLKDRHWLYYSHGGSWIAQKDWGFHPKKANISILLSDKESMAGHRLRHKILAVYGNRFDGIFGIDRHVTPFEAYAPYRYSVVVENERAPGYFTEKLIDCLTVGTIPIYWGDPEIGEVFHDGGIRQFDGIDDLIFELDAAMKEKPYAESQEAIKTNWTIAQIYAVCEDRIHARYPHLFGGSDG